MTEFPIWLVALIVAGAAPFLVRGFADEVERRHRRRTEDVLTRAERADAAAREGGGDAGSRALDARARESARGE